ncbi:MAG TPA: hypothetical protein VHQ47_05590 [Phycisphaerae bacterium]|jgi:Tfp pilus assembly protein PilX|nr:hypothetical protein [Phycisphaerae bacterium]
MSAIPTTVRTVSPLVAPGAGPRRRRRGVAMLLVMVGLVVCSILVAGFLSSQGTSIGIAHNERDAEIARNYAQSGIDMCYWLVVNRSDWRTNMNPGAWLTNYPIGSGTVSVTTADGAGNSSFTTDPTQPLLVTSTGSCNGRSFTVSASITPTGGGTVFGGGAFTLGQLILHNTAAIDSFNSSVAPYNILFPGSNALFSTNYSGSGALTMDGLSVFRGSFLGGPTSLLGSIVQSILGLLIPTNVSVETQVYIPGHIIPPNTAGLTTYGAKTLLTNGVLAPGEYTSVTNTKVMTLNTSGTYHITGNLTSTVGSISVSDGVNAVVEIDGATSVGAISVKGAGMLTLYVNGSSTFSGSISSAGGAANMRIFGMSSASNITLQGATSITAVVFAPQASVYLTDSSKLSGSVIAHDITADKSSGIHYDEATKSVRIDNITSGSAPTGTADYVVTRLGGS